LRPEVLQEFLAGEHAVAMNDEIGQHVEHFRAKLDQSARAAQFTPLRVERLVTKEIPHGVASRVQRCCAAGALVVGLQ
jgi:hypothetical protein